MKIIIIGRGPSCLKCKKAFVESHDLIVVTNNFKYKGYEEYVGSRADIQFRNRSTRPFSPEAVGKLGLKKVIFSNNNGYVDLPGYYSEMGVEVVRPHPPIMDVMSKEYNFSYSTGMVAIYYVLNNYNIDELSIVGIDLYEKDMAAYYFKKEDADPGLRRYYRNNRVLKGGIVRVDNHHQADKSAEFIKDMIMKKRRVRFNILTNSTRFVGFDPDNVLWL